MWAGVTHADTGCEALALDGDRRRHRSGVLFRVVELPLGPAVSDAGPCGIRARFDDSRRPRGSHRQRAGAAAGREQVRGFLHASPPSPRWRWHRPARRGADRHPLQILAHRQVLFEHPGVSRKRAGHPSGNPFHLCVVSTDVGHLRPLHGRITALDWWRLAQRRQPFDRRRAGFLTPAERTQVRSRALRNRRKERSPKSRPGDHQSGPGRGAAAGRGVGKEPR